MGSSGTVKLGDDEELLDTLQEFMDAFPFFMFIVDEEHRVLRANKAIYWQLKQNPESVVGECCHRAFHRSEEPLEGCLLMEAKATNDIVEKNIYDPNNDMHCFSCVYPTAFITSDGKRLFVHTARHTGKDDCDCDK